jgi:hypothetical protein
MPSKSKPQPKRSHHKKKPTAEAAAPGELPQGQPVVGDALMPGPSWYRNLDVLLTKLEKAKALPHSREQAEVISLKGRELGLMPIQALSQMRMEEGRIVAENVELQRALAGRVGGTFVPVEVTEQKCVVRAVRPRPWGTEEGVFEYTIQEAGHLVAGWRRSNAPIRDMLFARASGRACRAMFADALAGLSYTADEIQGTQQPPPAPKAAQTGESAPAQEAPPPSPAAPPAPEPEQQSLPTYETITVNGEQRVLNHPVTLRTKDGKLATIYTAGIEGAQIEATQLLIGRDPSLKVLLQRWLSAQGLPMRFGAMLREEGLALLEHLHHPAQQELDDSLTENQQARLIKEAREPMTFDTALKELDQVIHECGVGDQRDEALLVAAMMAEKQRIEELRPDQVLHVSKEMRTMSAEHPDVFKHALSLAHGRLHGPGPS